METRVGRNMPVVLRSTLAAGLLLSSCSFTESDSESAKTAISLSIDPESVTRGGTVTIQWAATNASSCHASDGWWGIRSTNGSEVFTSSETGRIPFTLTCTGPHGSAERTVKLTVFRTISPP